MEEKVLTEFKGFLKKKNYVPRTNDEYVRDVIQFMKQLNKKKLNPSKKDYKDYLQKLSRKKRAGKTISRVVSSLKIFSQFLYQSDRTKKDEATHLSHPIVLPRGLKILKKEEIQKLRSISAGSILDSALLETLLQTGMTISELSKLRWEQITLVKGPTYGKIILPPHRSIPINNKLEEIIRRHEITKEEITSPYVFKNRKGGRMNVRVIRSKLNGIFTKAGLKNFYVNDLRHNFIYHQLLRGVDPGTVAHWVGFKNLATLHPFLKKLGRRNIVNSKLFEV